MFLFVDIWFEVISINTLLDQIVLGMSLKIQWKEHRGLEFCFGNAVSAQRSQGCRNMES